MSEPSTIKSYPARPRWLKVFLDIWENRSRTALVVASIAVGVFAVGMIVSTYIIIEDDMEISFSSSNPANIEITTDPFGDDLVSTVQKMDGVEQAEGRFRTTLRLSQDNGATWRSLTVYSVDDYEESAIYLKTTLDGNGAPQDREIVLESRILDSFDIEVGDQLLIQLSNGTTRAVPVVGFVRDQGIGGGPDAEAVAYVTMDTLTWLGQNRAFNQMMVTVEGDGVDQAAIDTVATQVEDRIEDSGRTIRGSQTNLRNEHPAKSTVLAILTVLGAMGVLMLILGGSLIANTLTALLNQQMRQIGVMKLVGARNLQVVSMYLVLIISLGLISLIISIPLSAWAGYRFAVFFSGLLNINLLGFRFVPVAIVVQVLIAIFIPILAGIFPVMSGSRRTVEEAISDSSSSIGGGGEGWFERLGESMEWISRPLLISFRNTFRNMRRLALTLFTLTMAGAIFISVFNVQASLQMFIGSVGGLFKADLSIPLSRPYREEELANILESIPGVIETEGWLGAAADTTLQDGSEVIFAVQAPPADTDLLEPELRSGRYLQAGDQNVILVSESIWEEIPDLETGDELMLSISDGREEPWTVIGIFAFPGRDVDSHLVYAPYDVIATKNSQIGMATTMKVVTGGETLAEQEAMGDIVDVVLQEQGIQFSAVEPGLETTESVGEAISTLISFFLGMAGLTAVVGSIGLAGTMSMNVMDRIREIGILRAIGAVDRAVMSSVLIEGVFIGVLSWLLGIVLNFPISFGLLRMVSLALTNSIMPLRISPTGFWLWICVILVLSTVASLVPARNASRLTIREVLAYE